MQRKSISFREDRRGAWTENKLQKAVAWNKVNIRAAMMSSEPVIKGQSRVQQQV